MRTIAFVTVALLATAMFVKRGLARSFSDREYTAERMAVIDPAGARQVRVEGSTGDLRVVAVEGLHEVRARGTARGSSHRVLDAIKLDIRRDESGLVVRAVLPRQSKNWLGRPTRQALDMVVEVPSFMEADVIDGSGDAEVQGVSALRMQDASGDVRVFDVRGPVRLTDASGGVELDRIHGDVWIEDGSGDLSASNVMGSLVVSADGSGGISASRVHGDLLVRRDGSGDIDVADVAGRFIVREDGSGAVRYRDVKGEVDVPKKKIKRHERHE